MSFDALDKEVAARLEFWGRTYAMHIPAGSRRISQRAREVEEVVATILKYKPEVAIALRAYFCGSGERGVHRLEQCRTMLLKRGIAPLSKREFFNSVRVGICMVRAKIRR